MQPEEQQETIIPYICTRDVDASLHFSYCDIIYIMHTRGRSLNNKLTKPYKHFLLHYY